MADVQPFVRIMGIDDVQAAVREVADRDLGRIENAARFGAVVRIQPPPLPPENEAKIVSSPAWKGYLPLSRSEGMPGGC